MTNKEFYQKTFSQVHPSKDLQWEDFQSMRKKRFTVKRLVAVAAAAAILAALSAVAVAADWFGLRSILLPEKGNVYVTDENGVVIPGVYEEKDFVSLSGLQDTPESQALAEWQAFLDSYDQDGAIIARIGNAPTGFEERYGEYLVYTQEMAGKLEEIIAKYGLKLHTHNEIVLPGTWSTAVGDFCGENVTPYSGYIYEDGTFRFDGDADLGGTDLKGYGTIEYQFSRSVRGTFNEVALNIGDLADFQEWSYQAHDGTELTLALGRRNRSLILADLGDSFVLVNVLTGQEGDDTFSSGPIGRAELEELADSFRYTVLTPARTPDYDAIMQENARQMEALQDRPIETAPEELEDPLYVQTGIETDSAKAFIWDLSKNLASGNREIVADLFVYPCKVTAPHEEFTVNTAEELLEHYDDVIEYEIRGLLDVLDYHDLFASDGLVGVGQGCAWFGLVEDGEIRLWTLWNVSAGTGVRALEEGVSQG